MLGKNHAILETYAENIFSKKLKKLLDIAILLLYIVIIFQFNLPKKRGKYGGSIMKYHAYNPLRFAVETARKNGVDVDVFISTSTGIESIIGRIDSRNSGSKCGITHNGKVIVTSNPLRVKPETMDYVTVSYADMVWNPSTATSFIAELIKANKETVPPVIETETSETKPKTVETEKPKKIIRKRRAV